MRLVSLPFWKTPSHFRTWGGRLVKPHIGYANSSTHLRRGPKSDIAVAILGRAHDPLDSQHTKEVGTPECHTSLPAGWLHGIGATVQQKTHYRPV